VVEGVEARVCKTSISGFQLVAGSQGNVGVAFTGAGNPRFGILGTGANYGVQMTSADAQSIYDLGGQSFSFGLSGAIAGASAAVDPLKEALGDALVRYREFEETDLRGL